MLREAFRQCQARRSPRCRTWWCSGEVPAAIRQNMELWDRLGVVALRDTGLLTKLQAAGFEGADIRVTPGVLGSRRAREFLAATERSTAAARPNRWTTASSAASVRARSRR